MVSHMWNLGTWFKTNLGYLVTSCLKTQKEAKLGGTYLNPSTQEVGVGRSL